MRLDRSSDDDYVPSSVVVNDVAMSAGDNRTLELNGLGDSHDASTMVPVSMKESESHPSTVSYLTLATQDTLRALRLAEYEIGMIALRPAELDSCTTSLDGIDVAENVEQWAQVVESVTLSDHHRIVRLEKVVEADRDLQSLDKSLGDGLVSED